MYLLNTISLELEEFQATFPPYAILSHRWQDDEVSFKDVELRRHRSRKGFDKVDRCCKLARERGFSYVWIDNCCIDKRSSAELSEAINSMFSWYQGAEECYAYLCDVEPTSIRTDSTDTAFATSVWFSRGWTLQELIAPKEVYFFNTRWLELGRRSALVSLLQQITGIAAPVLRGQDTLSGYPIARRLSWAASRTTTRIEDEAYCLLGILEVNMPLLYGEGQKSFTRLQEEVLKQSDDQTIFAWSDSRYRKSVLAPSVSCFKGLNHVFSFYAPGDNRVGYTLGNSGLSIPATLIPWSVNIYLIPLACGAERAGEIIGPVHTYMQICIFVEKLDNPGHFVRVSHDRRDKIQVNSLDLEDIQSRFQLRSRQVFLKQRQINSQSERHFNGIHLNFAPTTRPSQSRGYSSLLSCDIASHHPFNQELGILQAPSPLTCAVGAIRLRDPTDNSDRALLRHRSRKKRNSFLFFAFKPDFIPICLVTDKRPDMLTSAHRDNVWSDDLGKLSEAGIKRLLDLKWVMEEAEKALREGRRQDVLVGTPEGNNILANWDLGIKMSFVLRQGEELGKIWTVAFEEW